MLFVIKENEQFDLICNDITLKHSSHKNFLGVTINNKPSLNEHIKISTKQLTKTSTLSVEQVTIWNKIKRKYYYLSFIISHFSYCYLIWMFCSKKSSKKINAVHERSLQNSKLFRISLLLFIWGSKPNNIPTVMYKFSYDRSL